MPASQGIAPLEVLEPVGGRCVLVRVDFNVPLAAGRSGGSEVADDFRMRSALPTIHWLVERGAKVTLASHLGRPKGHPVPELTMAPVQRRLDELVPGVRMLENLRFDPGEEGNDPEFGARLVAGQDLYVNDAFGTCHRAHASVVFPPTVLPSAAGRLLGSELEALGRILSSPPRPFTVVAGGAKVADKLGALRAVATHADRLVLGGGMALTFLAALGRGVGASRIEPDQFELCRALLDGGAEVMLPTDLVAAPGTVGEGNIRAGEARRFAGDVPAGWTALDIGPDSAVAFRHAIDRSAAVLWNGPMGVFERAEFAAGTRAVAAAVACCDGFTVVGGGDTVSAVRRLGIARHFDHLSTGGGAMYALLEHGDLPGLAALRKGNPYSGRSPLGKRSPSECNGSRRGCAPPKG